MMMSGVIHNGYLLGRMVSEEALAYGMGVLVSLQLVVSVQRSVQTNNSAGEIFGLRGFHAIIQENKCYVEHVDFDARAISKGHTNGSAPKNVHLTTHGYS